MTSRLKQIEEYQEQHKRILFKIVDNLEQRIATLEKVLASHAKCIGRLAHDKENRNEQS
jgi:NAD+--asparagine ADP-ribosyltransferase|tara:strand:- start:278 stop:454 length:177 start_codon:yes stop_codon:yes gene_type:complete